MAAAVGAASGERSEPRLPSGGAVLPAVGGEAAPAPPLRGVSKMAPSGRPCRGVMCSCPVLGGGGALRGHRAEAPAAAFLILPALGAGCPPGPSPGGT